MGVQNAPEVGELSGFIVTQDFVRFVERSLSGMIIPDRAYPSWTNADASDANLYSIHRQRLWTANYCVSIWPQVFSWIVVNVYPASSEHDYRFESTFANRAILVTIDWHKSGKGCKNAKCYATYPPGNRCDIKDAPIVFPSGNKTVVEACQPACFARERSRLLMKTANKEISLTDQVDPKRTCADCKLLDQRVAFGSRRWRFGNDRQRIDVFDSRNGKIIDIQHETIGRAVATRDESGSPELKVDSVNVEWDEKYENCSIVNDFVFRTVVEPLYRDPGAICKLTNFEIGDDVEWGFRYREDSSRVIPNYGFLVKHSTSYCRAFAKNLTDEGECKQPWWQSALSNTIAGDGIIHAIHALVHYDPNCVQTWKVDNGDRQQPSIKFSPSTNYDMWRRDINTDLILPPPNVTLLDLGINVKETGNRLYWNSVEGIISHLALFRSITNKTEDAQLQSTQKTKKKSRLDPTSLVENERVKVNRYHKYAQPVTRHWGGRGHILWRLKRETGSSEQTRAINEYRDLLLTKTNRMRDRAASKLEKADGFLRDKDLDVRIENLWKQQVLPLLSRTRREASEPTIVTRDVFAQSGSVSYSLETNEYASQRYVDSRIGDDLLPSTRSETASTRTTKLVVPSAARTVTWRANDSEDADLQDLIQHIEEEIEHGEASTLLQDLGLAVGYEVADRLLRKSLKFAFAKITQMLSRYSSGVSGLVLMKIGARIGLSKMFGNLAARLTSKLMMLVGQAASVVGLVIDSISLVSLLFDIAEIAGWDPGSFRNEQDLRFYYDMAVYFAETLTDAQRGPVSPLEMMLIYTSVEDSAGDGSQKTTTAETAVNDPVDNVGTNEESSATKTLHIDQRLRYPKWFNKSFTKCFSDNAFSVMSGIETASETLDVEHVKIQDSVDLWGLVTSLDFLGGLSTNSFGQLIMPETTTVRLRDEDISSLVTEIEYRDLLTVSSRASVDSTAYNRRIDSTTKIQRIGLLLTSAVAGISVLSILAKNFFVPGTAPKLLNIIDFNLSIIIIVTAALVIFLYTSLVYVPVAASTSSTSTPTFTRADTSVSDTETDEKKTLHYYADTLRNVVDSL